MCLKDQERELLEKIESKGYERLVRHLRFDEPKNVEIGMGEPISDTIAVTFVVIYRESSVTDGFVKDFTNTQSVSDVNDFAHRNHLGEGIIDVAVCSSEDTFNKTLGRVIATGRAVKQLM